MRIAIVNHHRNLIGGVESYLSQLLPALMDCGYQTAFWSADQADPAHPQISIPAEMPAWSVAELGERAALAALADRQPDVIYAHGLRSPELEKKVQQIAPAVFFAHAYYGTCISGAKTFRRPEVQACDKRFGWPCLLNYYPRRCGGLNPATMIKQGWKQADRLALLSNYQAIVVASKHMAAEYCKYGLSQRVEVVGLPIAANIQMRSIPDSRDGNQHWRLLFLGRMDELKGGEVLLDSLPLAQSELANPFHITFAGDGPNRTQWEQRANQLSANHPGLVFDFTGWVTAQRRDELLQKTDLIIVPSVWPEPFGLVGLEAGQFAVPAAAFDVGGISDWLADGINGALAAPETPLAKNLAAAIVRCLKNETVQRRLAKGAADQSSRFSLRAHLEKLLPVFDLAVGVACESAINQEVVQYQ